MSFLDRMKRLLIEPADPPPESSIRKKDHELRNLTMRLQQVARKNEEATRILTSLIQGRK